jgi:hypothetical protein
MDRGAALALPFADTEAMQLHLEEIAANVAAGAHVGLGGLLHERAKAHHLVGHRWFRGCVGRRNPILPANRRRPPHAAPEAKCAPTLCVATHRPNLAAHIDQLETMPRQFAERLPIAGQDRRHGAAFRIFDFVTICQIEVSHGITDGLVVFDDIPDLCRLSAARPLTIGIAQNAMQLLLLNLRASPGRSASADASERMRFSTRPVDSRHLPRGRPSARPSLPRGGAILCEPACRESPSASWSDDLAARRLSPRRRPNSVRD